MADPASIASAPPDTPLGRARAGLDSCVHCGFCLQACPTYLALEDENDSPRGRLVLMRALVDGVLPADDPSVRTHIDRCLGCRGCETACPSGVPYGELLEATRATLAASRPLPLVARIILWVFARARWLAVACAGARIVRASNLASLLGHLPGRFGFAMAMLASTAPSATGSRRRPAASRTAGGAAERPPGPSTPPTLVLRGCIMEGLFRNTNRATERLLARAGARVVDAPGQVCCGALHAHAGDLDGARALARTNVAAFTAARAAARAGGRISGRTPAHATGRAAPRGATTANGADGAASAMTIVTNAAGCGAMLKTYGHLLADDPEWAERAAEVAAATRDISEVIAPALGTVAHGAREAGAAPRVRVAYDPPCHLLHAQRVDDAPRAILTAAAGVELVPLADADQCCGAAGIYNLLQPHVSDAVLAPKLAAIAASGAAWVATGNPGCLMQIGAGLRRAGSHARTVHPVDVLDASLGD